jgi:hypothetical protein
VTKSTASSVHDHWTGSVETHHAKEVSRLHERLINVDVLNGAWLHVIVDRLRKEL